MVSVSIPSVVFDVIVKMDLKKILSLAIAKILMSVNRVDIDVLVNA